MTCELIFHSLISPFIFALLTPTHTTPLSKSAFHKKDCDREQITHTTATINTFSVLSNMLLFCMKQRKNPSIAYQSSAEPDGQNIPPQQPLEFMKKPHQPKDNNKEQELQQQQQEEDDSDKDGTHTQSASKSHLCNNMEIAEGMREDSGRERLKRHRVEVAGRDWIPDIWGQEELLKDWIDCTAFDAPLVPSKIVNARTALVEEDRKATTGGLRFKYRC